MKTYYVLAASDKAEVQADEVEVDEKNNLIFRVQGEIVARFNHWSFYRELVPENDA